MRRDLRFLGRRAVLQIRSDRSRVRPWGQQGSNAGTTSRNVLVTPNGEERALPSKFVMEIVTGDVWQHTTASGSGWGNPTLRQTVRIEPM